MKKGTRILLKRVYENGHAKDGRRILVDRLWPRGIKKDNAKIDLWLKEIAPSHALRKWFNHKPEKWEEFRRRYLQELDQNQECVGQLIQHAKKGNVTLLFSAKNEVHNNAVALREYILSRL